MLRAALWSKDKNRLTSYRFPCSATNFRLDHHHLIGVSIVLWYVIRTSIYTRSIDVRVEWINIILYALAPIFFYFIPLN